MLLENWCLNFAFLPAWFCFLPFISDYGGSFPHNCHGFCFKVPEILILKFRDFADKNQTSLFLEPIALQVVA